MEKTEIHCDKCNETTLHTIRLYETKTKHYSVLSFGSDKRVSVICHTCLLESILDEGTQKELITKYNKEITAGLAYEFSSKKKYEKAEKTFKKILKKDPEYVQALYGLSQCLIAQNKYDEAKFYVERLDLQFPDLDEVRELKESLEGIRP